MPAQIADIGHIRLAVMGQNLVLTRDDHGSTVTVDNRGIAARIPDGTPCHDWAAARRRAPIGPDWTPYPARRRT